MTVAPMRVSLETAPRTRGTRRLLSFMLLFSALCSLFLFPLTCLAAEAPPRIGIIMPSFRESRWEWDLQYLQDSALKVGADVMIRFAGNDPQLQNAQIRELADLEADVIILCPTDVRAVCPAVDYVRERGVKIVSYDRLVEGCDVNAYVAFERKGVGGLMGKYLAEHAPKGKYILMYGPSSDSNAKDFFDGAMQYLNPLIEKGDITVVEKSEVEGWHADAAKRIVEKTLAGNPDISAVLAPNDDTARGAIEALQAAGLAGKVLVTGQDATSDALQRIHAGTQSMTVLKDQYLLAQETIAVTMALYNNERYPYNARFANGFKNVPTALLPVMFIDRERLPWLLRLQDFR